MTTVADLTIPNAGPVHEHDAAPSPVTETTSLPCPALDRLMLKLLVLCFILMAGNMIYDLLSGFWVR